MVEVPGGSSHNFFRGASQFTLKINLIRFQRETGTAFYRPTAYTVLGFITMTMSLFLCIINVFITWFFLFGGEVKATIFNLDGEAAQMPPPGSSNGWGNTL